MRPAASGLLKTVFFAIFLVCFIHQGYAQEEGETYCMACSREAWAGDSVALNKFIAACGMVDTVGYDSLDVEVREKPVVQKITMKLNSGKVLYRDSIYLVPDKAPEYEGGMAGLLKYITESIRYPEDARKNGTTGTVYVEIVVERDGTVRHARITRGIGHGCDEESVRVLRASKGWTPGQKGGKNVRVQVVVPVRFSLR